MSLDPNLCPHDLDPKLCEPCRATISRAQDAHARLQIALDGVAEAEKQAETEAEAWSATRQGTAHHRIDDLAAQVRALQQTSATAVIVSGLASEVGTTHRMIYEVEERVEKLEQDLHARPVMNRQREREVITTLRRDRNSLVDQNKSLIVERDGYKEDRDRLRRVLDDLRESWTRVAQERDQARNDVLRDAAGKGLAEANGTIKLLTDDVARLQSNGHVYRQQIAEAGREIDEQKSQVKRALEQANHWAAEAKMFEARCNEAVAREAKEYKHHQTELAAAKKEEAFQHERANDAIQYSGKVIEELHVAQAQIADLHKAAAEATHDLTVEDAEDNRALYKDGRVTSWSVNYHQNGIHFLVESKSRPGARQRFKLDPSLLKPEQLTRFSDALISYVRDVLGGSVATRKMLETQVVDLERQLKMTEGTRVHQALEIECLKRNVVEIDALKGESERLGGLAFARGSANNTLQECLTAHHEDRHRHGFNKVPCPICVNIIGPHSKETL